VESKQFLKLRIRAGNSSFQIGYDDGVGRGFEQLFKSIEEWCSLAFPGEAPLILIQPSNR